MPPLRSSVRLVNGQYVYQGIPLSRRIANQLIDPLGPVSTYDRMAYQTRYKAGIKQEENQLLNQMIRAGGQFDEEDIETLNSLEPGEILERVAGGGIGDQNTTGGSAPDSGDEDFDNEVLEKIKLQQQNEEKRNEIELARRGGSP